MAMRPAPIAILTDFGYRDHYVGVMKGVIARISPDTKIIDITHGVPPHCVTAGALALAQSWRFFPKRTIFLAVVDPGVGTTRLPIAIETTSGARFVGPDNGLLSLACRQAGIKRAVELRSPRYRLTDVSSTFHGRDVFAPAAAHLSRGVAISKLGPAVVEIKRLRLPSPQPRGETLRGEIIYVDAFGNLVTNIDRPSLARFQTRFNGRELLVSVEESAAMRIFKTYGDVPSETPLATFGSFDLLEIAVRDASAADHFSRREGARAFVKPKRRRD